MGKILTLAKQQRPDLSNRSLLLGNISFYQLTPFPVGENMICIKEKINFVLIGFYFRIKAEEVFSSEIRCETSDFYYQPPI